MPHLTSTIVLNNVLDAAPRILYLVVLPFCFAIAAASLASHARDRFFISKLALLQLATGLLYSGSGFFGLVAVINRPELGGLGDRSHNSNHWSVGVEQILHSLALLSVNCLLLYAFLARSSCTSAHYSPLITIVISLSVLWLLSSLVISITSSILSFNAHNFVPVTKISSILELLTPIIVIVPIILLQRVSYPSGHATHHARDLEGRPRLTGLRQVLHEGPAFAKALQRDHYLSHGTSCSTLVSPTTRDPEPNHSAYLPSSDTLPRIGSQARLHCPSRILVLLFTTQLFGFVAGIFDVAAVFLDLTSKDKSMPQARRLSVLCAYILKAIFELAWVIGSHWVVYSSNIRAGMAQGYTSFPGEERSHMSSGYEGSMLASSNGSQLNDPLRSVSEEFLDVHDPFSSPPPGSTIVLKSAQTTRISKPNSKNAKKSKIASKPKPTQSSAHRPPAGAKGKKQDETGTAGDELECGLEMDMGIHEALAYMLRADAEPAVAALEPRSSMNHFKGCGSSPVRGDPSKRPRLPRPILVARTEDHSLQGVLDCHNNAAGADDPCHNPDFPKTTPIVQGPHSTPQELPIDDSHGHPRYSECLALDLTGTNSNYSDTARFSELDRGNSTSLRARAAGIVSRASSLGRFASRSSYNRETTGECPSPQTVVKQPGSAKETLIPALKKFFGHEQDAFGHLGRTSQDDGSMDSGAGSRTDSGTSESDEALLSMVVMNAMGMKHQCLPRVTSHSPDSRPCGDTSYECDNKNAIIVGESSAQIANEVRRPSKSHQSHRPNGTRDPHVPYSPSEVVQCQTSPSVPDFTAAQLVEDVPSRSIHLLPSLSLLKLDLQNNEQGSRSGSQTPTPMNQASDLNRLCRTSPVQRPLPESNVRYEDEEHYLASALEVHQITTPAQSVTQTRDSTMSVSELAAPQIRTLQLSTGQIPETVENVVSPRDSNHSPSTHTSSLGAFVFTHHPHISGRMNRPPVSRTLTSELQHAIPNLQQARGSSNHRAQRIRALSSGNDPRFPSPIPIPTTKRVSRDTGSFAALTSSPPQHSDYNTTRYQSQLSSSAPSNGQVLRSRFSWSDVSSVGAHSRATNTIDDSVARSTVFPFGFSDERGRARARSGCVGSEIVSLDYSTHESPR